MIFGGWLAFLCSAVSLRYLAHRKLSSHGNPFLSSHPSSLVARPGESDRPFTTFPLNEFEYLKIFLPTFLMHASALSLKFTVRLSYSLIFCIYIFFYIIQVLMFRIYERDSVEIKSYTFLRANRDQSVIITLSSDPSESFPKIFSNIFLSIQGSKRL